VSQRRHENAVRVPWIDEHRADLPRVPQPEVLPAASGVGRFVDAVADRQVGPLEAFAAADVDDVRIGRRDGNRADRLRRLIVEQRRPGVAVVGRLPDAAVVDADIEDVRLLGDAGGAHRAAAAERADVAPLEHPEQCLPAGRLVAGSWLLGAGCWLLAAGVRLLAAGLACGEPGDRNGQRNNKDERQRVSHKTIIGGSR
jgi:hypothetical protein